MMRVVITGVCLAGALVLSGAMVAAVSYRPFGYRRPASACSAWGLA